MRAPFISIQSDEDRLKDEKRMKAEAASPLSARIQNYMETGEVNLTESSEKDLVKSAAAQRGTHDLTLDMNGGVSQGGGESQVEQADRFAQSNPDTMPKLTPQQQAANERLQAEGQHNPPEPSTPEPSWESSFRIVANGLAAAEAPSENNQAAAEIPNANNQAAEEAPRRDFDFKAMADEFEIAGQSPREGQTTVEALRERGEGGTVRYDNGASYKLDGDELVRTDRGGKETMRMNADEAHEKEVAKRQEAGTGMEI